VFKPETLKINPHQLAEHRGLERGDPERRMVEGIEGSKSSDFHFLTSSGPTEAKKMISLSLAVGAKIGAARTEDFPLDWVSAAQAGFFCSSIYC